MIDFDAHALEQPAMNTVAGSTPSKNKNGCETNGTKLILRYTRPQQHVMSTVAGSTPSESHHGCETNRKAYVCVYVCMCVCVYMVYCVCVFVFVCVCVYLCLWV